uniref:Tektin n=1 Tax=Panagrellus redivivus TaxID=6233 RepID=A0A7E4V2I3_PANRE
MDDIYITREDLNRLVDRVAILEARYEGLDPPGPELPQLLLPSRPLHPTLATCHEINQLTRRVTLLEGMLNRRNFEMDRVAGA